MNKSTLDALNIADSKTSLENLADATEKAAKKAKLKQKAETAEEFREKYGRKRFTSSTAGKSIIYSYIYLGYLKNEGLSNEEIIRRPLYKDLKAIRDKIASPNDAYVYTQYINLEEWLTNVFEAAIIMRNSVNSVSSHFYSIASGALAGENLLNALDGKESKEASLWLSLLSVDSIRPTTSSYQMALSLRQNIENGLRYIHAYNTLISIIATEIEIPELTLFQVNTESTVNGIAQLNDVLEMLRNHIKERETVPDEQAITTAPPAFTKKALAATLEAFSDVSPTAPPIPEENIKDTITRIRNTVIMNGSASWTRLMPTLCRNYWGKI